MFLRMILPNIAAPPIFLFEYLPVRCTIVGSDYISWSYVTIEYLIIMLALTVRASSQTLGAWMWRRRPHCLLASLKYHVLTSKVPCFCKTFYFFKYSLFISCTFKWGQGLCTSCHLISLFKTRVGAAHQREEKALELPSPAGCSRPL